MLLCAAAGLGILFCFVPSTSSLAFYDGETGKLAAYTPLKAGEPFSIEYTHSIHLTPVTESYELTAGGEIRQFELEYEEFNVGMPSGAEGKERFEVRDGKYVLTNMDRVFHDISLRTGKVRANHTLIIGKDSVPLSAFAEPGSLLVIKAQRLSLKDKLEGVKLFGKNR